MQSSCSIRCTQLFELCRQPGDQAVGHHMCCWCANQAPITARALVTLASQPEKAVVDQSPGGGLEAINGSESRRGLPLGGQKRLRNSGATASSMLGDHWSSGKLLPTSSREQLKAQLKPHYALESSNSECQNPHKTDWSLLQGPKAPAIPMLEMFTHCGSSGTTPNHTTTAAAAA